MSFDIIGVGIKSTSLISMAMTMRYFGYNFFKYKVDLLGFYILFQEMQSCMKLFQKTHYLVLTFLCAVFTNSWIHFLLIF